LTDGTIDVSDLPAGNYSIITLLYDGYIYVKASTSNFTIESAYDVTFANDGNGTTNQTGTIKVGSSTGIVINATPSTDYEFKAWESSNGGSFATTAADASNTFYPTANTTLTATFRSTAVNALLVVAGENITSVTGSVEPVTVGSICPISATFPTGYKFTTWTAEPAANATFADAASATTDVTVLNGSVTVTASAEEVLSTLTTANEYNEGTPTIAAPTASVAKIGVTTTATVTAAAGTGYTFAGWKLDNCVRTDAGADNATTITVKSNGDGADAKVTAKYEQNVVYFVNTKGWSTVKVYAWNDGCASNAAWSGVALTDANIVKQIGGCDVYKYVPGADYAKVIFNNGSEQTDDLAWQNGKYYVYNSENTKDVSDWYDESEVEGVLPDPVELKYTVEVPAGTHECYIAGDMNGWALTKMDPVDATHFTLTIQWATNAHKYKYAAGPTWDYEEQKADGSSVSDRTYNANDKVAKWKNVYNPSATVYDYYIVGTMNGWSEINEDYGMSKVGETTTYSKELNLAAGTHQFKVKKNGGDWYGEFVGDYKEVSYKDDNIQIVLTAATNVTIKFDSSSKKISFEGLTAITYSDITIKAYTESAAPQIWWWNGGSKCPDADKTDNPSNPGNKYTWETAPTMTAVAGEANWYEYTFKDVNDQTGICFKFKNATTASGNFEGIKADACYDVRDIANAKTTECGVTPTTCLECSGIYLKGEFNTWLPDNEFMKTGDANVVTLSITLEKGNYDFKVHGDEWYGNTGDMTRENTNQAWTFSKDVDDKANIRVDVSGEYIFSWKISEKQLTVTYPEFPGISNQPEKIYFLPNTNWRKDNATFAAFFLDGDKGTAAKWVAFTDPDGDGMYELTNDKKYLTMIFCRMDPNGTDSDNWKNMWNQSADITIPNTSYLNCWIDDLNWWNDATGTWAMPLSSGDNSAAIDAAEGQKVTALVNRSLVKDDGYYTLCVPFKMPASLVGKAYQISGLIQKNTDYVEVNLAESNQINAGAPYLIVPSETKDYLLVENVTIVNTPGSSVEKSISGLSVAMQGVINGAGNTDGLYWVGNGGYLYNDSASKLGLRTYFNITTPSGIAPRLRVVASENVETGIDNIVTTDTPVKVIENGQLIIIRDGIKYNVQGQKL
jgi:hypothetical protein